MQSLNFEFLRPKYNALADLGASAELYAVSDPPSAAVKLRAFAELLTGAIYERFRFPRPFETEFVRLLTAEPFKTAVPLVVQNTLHGMRKDGNQAAHGGSIEPRRALELLEDAFRLSGWWAVTDLGLKKESLTAFREPPKYPHPAPAVIATQEDELAAKVKALNELQQKYDQIPRETGQLEAIREQGQQTANLLLLSEEDTRHRLIDRDLTRAGWKVGHTGENTSEVTQEHILKDGTRADYVLWDDNGKPLAVIEAKKTSRELEAGRKQAALYANALEAQYGQRPFIFTTNGHDIDIWDDAQGYPPRPIFGFYSKQSLQYRIYQRSAKKPLAEITIDPLITDRLYQIEAIRRVSERFTQKFRKSLIVQATGTGKTRVAVSLTDVLMRASACCVVPSRKFDRGLC